MAALTFDSAEMRPVFGVRSAGQAEARQLLFNAGDRDLDVRVEPSGAQWVVSGQVLGASEARGRVVVEGESLEVSAALNDLSEFTLPALPAGNYTLRLILTDVEIEVPRFDLGV